MLYQRGKAYSQDLRERVFAASDDGERVGEIAELLRVSVAYVSKALTRAARRVRGRLASSIVIRCRSWRRSTQRSARMLPNGVTRRSRNCGRGCWRRIRWQRASG